MLFWERLKTAMAVMKGLPPIDLPASGRSSEETLSGAMSAYLAGFGSVSPVISFEALATLKQFWIHNPDFSQYVANIVNLGNPGHSISIDAANDARAEAAANRLNESASRIYDHGCGVDGLLNQYLTSIAWSGVISSEDVVNIPGRRVEKVVLVPVEKIRFKYNRDLDIYEPYQKSTNLFRSGDAADHSSLGLIKLNTETYKYYALQTIENSPYGKPPATAAIEAILETQKPIMDNIRFVAKKYGILGLVAMGIAPIKQKPQETDQEYAKRFEDYIKRYADSLSGSFNQGLVVYPKPNSIDTTSVATNASGLDDVHTISEQQVISGLNSQPVFFGRSDSSTETFADVVYFLLTGQVSNIQRPVKRRMEQTYRLDLRLGGLEVDGVSVTFNKAHSRNALQEAQTEQIRLTDVLTKVRSGLITPDEGAQELGYDQWDDPAMVQSDPSALPVQQQVASQSRKTGRTLQLSFAKDKQRYVFQPERLTIAGGEWGEDESVRAPGGNVVPIKKKALQIAGA